MRIFPTWSAGESASKSMLILLGWVRSDTAWTYSLNTESTYKWVADKWSLPINGVISKLLSPGPGL